MPQEINQEGIFRGRIIQYRLDTYDSGSVAVSYKARIDDILSDKEWYDWREHEFEAIGKIFIVGKEGNLIERSCKSLIDNAGWDGDITSIVENTWSPSPVQFTVGEEEYNGQTQFRIKWLNNYDWMPGQGSASSKEASDLQNKFGAQLRAMAGGKNKTKVSPAKPTGTKQKNEEETVPADKKDDDIPF